MIKELISTSSKPGVKPAAAPTPAASELPKVAAAEAAKTAPAAPPAAKPAEKAVEPKPATPPKEPAPKPAEVKTPETAKAASPVASAGDAEVSKALQAWASAWASKDVKAHLGFYASDFQTPNHMPRKAWESERTQRIDKPGKLQVTVAAVCSCPASSADRHRCSCSDDDSTGHLLRLGPGTTTLQNPQ